LGFASAAGAGVAGAADAAGAVFSAALGAGGAAGFERVFDLVEAAAEGLLEEVRRRHLG
jgi:hypothetical protein